MGKWWRIKYRTSVNRALILTGSVLLKILKEKKNIFICTRILSVILSRPVTQRLQWYRPRRGGHPSLWMAFPLSSRVPIRGRWYSQCPFPACCFLLPWFDHKSTRTMFIRWPLVDIERNKNIDDILHVPLYVLWCRINLKCMVKEWAQNHYFLFFRTWNHCMHYYNLCCCCIVGVLGTISLTCPLDPIDVGCHNMELTGLFYLAFPGYIWLYPVVYILSCMLVWHELKPIPSNPSNLSDMYTTKSSTS